MEGGVEDAGKGKSNPSLVSMGEKSSSLLQIAGLSPDRQKLSSIKGDIDEKQAAVAEKVQKKVRKTLKKLASIEATLNGQGNDELTDAKRSELQQEKYRLKQEADRLR